MDFIQSKRKTLHWESSETSTGREWCGDTLLASLALLYAGEDPRSSDMGKTLDWISRQSLNATYVVSLRAQVLALVPGEKFKKTLAADLQWLIHAPYRLGPYPGGYTYESVGPSATGGGFDNSNSQFGVLGVWMASETGARADGLAEYWKLVETHWLATQLPDGGWGYQHSAPSTGSMTAAGLASLFIIYDRSYTREQRKKAAGPLVAAMERGLDWFGQNFSVENPGASGAWRYYYYYGVERAARASGKKYLRDKDWFRTIAVDLLRTQNPNGSWKEDLRDTAFSLLFLCHGRAPILLNKLEHADDWNTHLRDAAGLTRYAQSSLERLLNWQSLSLENATLDDLLEAPILYLNGDSAWTFSEAEKDKLAEYSRRGGMILAVAGKTQVEFATSMRRLSRELFPTRFLRRITRDHPLFNGQVQTRFDQPPEAYEVSNGTRTVFLLLLDDLAPAWSGAVPAGAEPHLQLGTNVYLYATDKTTVRSRLSSATIPLEPADENRTIRIALAQYGGPWEVEPYGWDRLTAYLHNQCGVRLEVSRGVPLESSEFTEHRIAFITGTMATSFSESELSGLRRFLNDGGTLIVDAAMGSRKFLDSMETQLSALLHAQPERIPVNSPLFAAQSIPGAASLKGVEYRRSVRSEQRGREFPPLKGYALGKRWAVIISPLDLSTSMLGALPFDCPGYAGDGSLRIMRNLLLYAGMSTGEKAKLHE